MPLVDPTTGSTTSSRVHRDTIFDMRSVILERRKSEMRLDLSERSKGLRHTSQQSRKPEAAFKVELDILRSTYFNIGSVERSEEPRIKDSSRECEGLDMLPYLPTSTLDLDQPTRLPSRSSLLGSVMEYDTPVTMARKELVELTRRKRSRS
ncbi:hypothetical protein PMIN02_005436 [Paraphaeosphaeria minitans]